MLNVILSGILINKNGLSKDIILTNNFVALIARHNIWHILSAAAPVGCKAIEKAVTFLAHDYKDYFLR
jgi:hypothetical protein